MNELTQKICTPCSSGALKMSLNEIEGQRMNIPKWDLLQTDDIYKIQSVFTFKNFQQALTFTNQVGEIAENEGHHPSILTEWGRVTITLWTHKIKGLHINDFIMAAKIDQLI
jgi:4a-hydroxytetrahydrobiopterin dehydratase